MSSSALSCSKRVHSLQTSSGSKQTLILSALVQVGWTWIPRVAHMCNTSSDLSWFLVRVLITSCSLSSHQSDSVFVCVAHAGYRSASVLFGEVTAALPSSRIKSGGGQCCKLKTSLRHLHFSPDLKGEAFLVASPRRRDGRLNKEQQIIKKKLAYFSDVPQEVWKCL